MPIFSLQTTFRQIWEQPCFTSWQHMLDYRRNGMHPWVDDVTMEQFGARTGWSIPLMLESLEFTHARCQHGQVFYPIYDTAADGKDKTGLAAFPLEKKSKFVVIVPGGGYGAVCSLIDGYAYARRLNEMGYAAFVVCYRVYPYTQPAPQEDLAQAVRFILEHAEQFRLDPEGYAVMGFSAGGHLAGSFGVRELGYGAYGLPKPGAMMLCYPVISMAHPATNIGSRNNFLTKAELENAEMLDRWSLERRVTADYPPTFVWQCEGDPMVSVENSALLAQALRSQGVAWEYEVFSYAFHGLPEQADEHAGKWLQRAVDFWEKHRR